MGPARAAGRGTRLVPSRGNGARPRPGDRRPWPEPETLSDRIYYARLGVTNKLLDAFDDVEEWIDDRVDRIEKALKNRKLSRKQKAQLQSAQRKVVEIGETSLVVLDGA